MIYKFTEGNRSIAILGTKTKNVREKRVQKPSINLITIYNKFTNLTIYNRLTNSQRHFIHNLRDVVKTWETWESWESFKTVGGGIVCIVCH